MKDALESTTLDTSADEPRSMPERPEVGSREGFSNRKLIRPSLSHRQEKSEKAYLDRNANGKKAPPPNQTFAENFYFQKQMQSRTPMVVVLADGEQIHGVIEWYDQDCIKVNRPGSANLLIYKSCIKYLYKEAEANGRE